FAKTARVFGLGDALSFRMQFDIVTDAAAKRAGGIFDYGQAHPLLPNSKSENRNPKQIRSTNKKTRNNISDSIISNFEFRYCFEFRYAVFDFVPCCRPNRTESRTFTPIPGPANCHGWGAVGIGRFRSSPRPRLLRSLTLPPRRLL